MARHRVDPPRLGTESDPAGRAAALLHTLICLKPLPYRNSLVACQVAAAYMHISGQGIVQPDGALVDLAREVLDGRAEVYAADDRIRSWRI